MVAKVSGSRGSGNPKLQKNFKNAFGYATDIEAIKHKQSPIDQLASLANAAIPEADSVND